jgi:DNA-binding NtrC family response regulator
MLKSRHILIVEDDEFVGASLAQRLELEGARVNWMKQMVRALGAIRTPAVPIDAVVCDIGLPDGSGEELFTTLCRTGTPPPFLFITGRGGIDQAVRLLKFGAADYITKPFDLTQFLDRLMLLLAPRAEIEFPPLVGISPAARRVEELILQAAGDDRPVLIRGDKGTGKDQVAARIHALSERRAARFVAVNLARDPSAAKALFGPEGAMARTGEGTLFLHAIDRLDAADQGRLAQALQGGIAARLVTAGGEDLDHLVESGTFDPDLFYRLAEREIRIPGFHDRPEDAVWLMHRLFDRMNGRDGRSLSGMSTLSDTAVRAHPWPGGGREIRSRLLRALQLAPGPMIQPADLFPEWTAGERVLTLAEARDAAERAQIIAALDRTKGQIGEAARLLRVSRTTLWEKMQKLGLS